MKRIAVTGATGAIGSALISECIKNNVEVYVLLRKNSLRRSNIPESGLVHVIECNLDELDDLPLGDMPPCDVFYHMGWAATIGSGRDDMRLQIQNIDYTMAAVHLAARLGCGTFVGAGSQAEYGRCEGKLSENTPTAPENGYGIAKLCAGRMAKIECERLGLRFVWARILSVYGPYDNENTMVMSTINKLLRGESASFTKGEQMWDYLYSGDAARALMLLGKTAMADGVYCLGSGSVKPLAEYIEDIKDAAGSDAKLCMGDIPYSKKQVMYLCADISKLQRDTGFVPETSFEDGIRETVEWAKKRL